MTPNSSAAGMIAERVGAAEQGDGDGVEADGVAKLVWVGG